MDSVKVKIFKQSLKIINFLNFIFSCILAIIGFYHIFLNENYTFEFSKYSIKLISISYITSSIFLFKSTILCILLSKKKDTKLIIAYILFMLIAVMLLSLIGLNGFYLIKNDKIKLIIKHNMMEMINNYDEKLNSNYETRSLDWLHKKYKCCGVNDYRDWTYKFNQTFLEKRLNLDSKNFISDIPDSCCLITNYNCGKQYTKKLDTINSNGCFELFINKYSIDLKILCKLSIIFFIVILFCLFSSLFLILFINYDYLLLLDK